MSAAERARAKRLHDNFNLTPQQWDAINVFQKGLCFLCGKAQKSGKRLATDHSHSSGIIRGLLCSQCNRLLGRIERSGWTVIILLRLLEYLTNHPATQALGEITIGYAGRCGTKKHRALLKRQLKNKIKSATA